MGDERASKGGHGPRPRGTAHPHLAMPRGRALQPLLHAHCSAWSGQLPVRRGVAAQAAAGRGGGRRRPASGGQPAPPPLACVPCLRVRLWAGCCCRVGRCGSPTTLGCRRSQAHAQQRDQALQGRHAHRRQGQSAGEHRSATTAASSGRGFGSGVPVLPKVAGGLVHGCRGLRD